MDSDSSFAVDVEDLESDADASKGPISSNSTSFEVIEQNRQKFKPNKEHSNYAIKDDIHSKSLIYKYGVKLVENSNQNDARHAGGVWYCLCSGCFERKKFFKVSRGSTANATQHLSHKHSLKSDRTKKRESTEEVRTLKQSVDKKLISQDEERFYGLATAAFAAAGTIPIRQFDTEEFKRLFSAVKSFPKLYDRKMKSFMLDLYIYVQEEIKSMLKANQYQLKVPFLHLSVDVYTSKLLNTKFLGISGSFTDVETRSVKRVNLGIRSFKPSSELREKNRISDIMHKWLLNSLTGLDLSEESILTTTSDGGSDVKRLLSKCVDRPREWCIAHIINLCLVDAFGVSLHANKCKNPEAREVSAALRRVLEHVNKSDYAWTKIQEAQINSSGKSERLANFIQQRWSSAREVYRKFLKNFSILQNYFNERATMAWPENVSKRVVQEYFSILQALDEPLRASQSDADLSTKAISQLQIVYARFTPGKPLQLYATDGKMTNIRNFEDLVPSTQKVLTTLYEALSVRYFHRYDPVDALVDPLKAGSKVELVGTDFKFNYIFELCQLLVPMLRNGNFLTSFIEGRAKKIESTVAKQKKITVLHKERIVHAAWNILKQSAERSRLEVGEITSETGLKRKASSIGGNDEEPENVLLRLSGSSWSPAKIRPLKEKKSKAEGSKDIADLLQLEIDKYLLPNTGLDEVQRDEALEFWCDELKGKRFPTLARFALAFLSARPSSAGLERDFSPISDIITRKRANLSPWFTEVLTVLKLNTRLFPDDLSRVKSNEREHDSVIQSLSMTFENRGVLEEFDTFLPDSEEAAVESDEDDVGGHDASNINPLFDSESSYI